MANIFNVMNVVGLQFKKLKKRCWNCNILIPSDVDLCCGCSRDTERFLGLE